MTKAQLRKAYRLLRKKLSEEDIETKSLDIANQLLKLPIWDKSFYHIFLSITEQKEINTDYILSILSGKDKHIVISKSDFETFEMTHYLLSDNTKLKKNKWNIPEPVSGIKIDTEQIEVVFIPLLVFDKKGNRIGYGKGFYDKFLAQCQPNTLKVGLSFFSAENEISDIYKNDITIDYCVTPSSIYQF
ncbi:5-formyltetrahydrofolate cyclo-ligase [Psychroserpens sp. Hel_I_66]|uniref:5-formyltetrahydrofolate cyclo-ligase n=1 Tax=Psychroserpens sp. Hel_I_66 TaxID=1250004 RepID=UPI000645B5F2|nr:5-formyltetrahydrofolate cyclo-ligase [Psychroserpens sp. Hel_I_66]